MTIKSRLTLVVSGLVTLALVLVGIMAYEYFRTNLKKTISSYQSALVSEVVDHLNGNISIAQSMLIGVSKRMSEDIILDVDRAQSFLDTAKALHNVFDNHIYLFRPDGRLVAEFPFLPGRRGLDYSYRDYIKRTVDTGKPVISDPYISSQSHQHPAIMLTVPKFDKQGRMVAILCGGLDLTRNNLLVNPLQTTIGKGGHFFLTTGNRLVIMHPDKNRIMKHFSAGKNRLYDRAVDQGFEGTEETVNSYGEANLVTLKRLPINNWIVGFGTPLKEAYAGVCRARSHYLVAGAVIIVLITLVVALLVSGHLAPLAALAGHMQGMMNKKGAERYFPAVGTDEIGVLGREFNRMISELDSRQALLHQKEELYRTLAEFSSDMIFWLDTDRRLLFISPTCEQLSGYTPEEFYSTPGLLESLVHEQDRPMVADAHQGAEAEAHALEFRLVTKTGDVRWVSHHCRPVYSGEGVFLGRRGSHLDITRLKEVEERISHLNEELEQRVTQRTAQLELSNKELEAFCYSVSHDLRAPLRALNGYSQILLEENSSELSAEGRRKVQNIARNAEQMGELIDDLLAFARLGRLPVACEEIDLHALVHEIFQEFSGIEESARINFILLDLPRVCGDRILLRQALFNLLANAVKFSQPVESPCIEVGSKQDGERVIYFIKDNGVGFDMQFSDKLFDVFQRLHPPGMFEGTGVGLAITKRVIERHGGEIWAEAAEGVGATFFFTLPKC